MCSWQEMNCDSPFQFRTKYIFRRYFPGEMMCVLQQNNYLPTRPATGDTSTMLSWMLKFTLAAAVSVFPAIGTFSTHATTSSVTFKWLHHTMLPSRGGRFASFLCIKSDAPTGCTRLNKKTTVSLFIHSAALCSLPASKPKVL